MSVNLGNLAIVAGTNTQFQGCPQSGSKALLIAGTNTQFQGCPQSGSKALLIGNESGLTCTITMEGGNVQKTLYPSTLDWFAIKKGFSGTVKIAPTALLNNTTSWPASSLVFDAVGLDDPEDASMYPLPLVRNTNVGNTVSTTGGSTTSVTNDNQPLTPQNQFIEATPTGAPGSTVVIATDGTMTIKGDVAGVLTTLLQLIPGAAAGASSAKLSDSTRQTEVLGSFLVDGTETVTGASTFTGDVTFNGLATIGTNNKFFKGKDSAGTIYRIAGYDNVNAKQLNLSDTAVGILADIQSNAKVDGTFEAAGAATMDSTLTVTGASTLTGAVTATNNSNNIQASTLQGGANLPAGRLGLAADGDILDGNVATATYLKARTSGTINFQTPNGTTICQVDTNGITLSSGKQVDVSNSGKIKLQAGAITRQTGFSGTGSGTFNTNLGTTPNQIVFNPCTVSGSSQTIGGTDAQSSVVTTGAGLAWAGIAWKDT